jgi:histidinol-phosphate aminotransferase
LLDLQPYSSARDEYTGVEGVFLDANENPFDNGMNRYPDPLQLELKERISILKSISSKQIFLGNGSDECIDLLLRLFCITGKDKISTISPSYGMYSVSAKINQVEIISILLNEDFTLNLEMTLEKSKNAKILFLCSPNNPSGNAFPKKEILEIVQKFDGLVVVDEAYVDFSKEESMLNEIENYSNLIVLQTFSKAYGLAGLRLGMLFASEEIVGWLNKIKPPYNINLLTQKTALSVLSDIKQIQEQISLIIKEREKLISALQTIPYIEKIFPSDANFILIKVNNANEVYNYLLENKIITRNRSSQPLSENCIRITVGTTEENNQIIEKLYQKN